MILDAQNQLSDSQALTATAISTNVIDLSSDRSIGSGEPMAVVFNVEVAADQTTGDEDYTFAVEMAAEVALDTTNVEIGRIVFESGTPTLPAFDADLLVAGFTFAIPVGPLPVSMSAQYLAARYTLAGTTPTITVSAHFIPLSGVQNTLLFANNYTIS